MKFFLFIFFIGILISLSFIQATGFSPTELIFEIKTNEKECGIISIISESETIQVSDKWAENKDLEWKVHLFEKDSNYHELELIYDKELSLDERKVEVCLSGSKAGEHHGVILLSEEQVGDSITQLGIWLKVIINEEPIESLTTSSESPQGGSGGGSIIETKEIVKEVSNEGTKSKEIVESEEDVQIKEEVQNSNPITGASIGTTKKNKTGIFVILIIIIITMFFIYNGRKNNEE